MCSNLFMFMIQRNHCLLQQWWKSPSTKKKWIDTLKPYKTHWILQFSIFSSLKIIPRTVHSNHLSSIVVYIKEAFSPMTWFWAITQEQFHFLPPPYSSVLQDHGTIMQHKYPNSSLLFKPTVNTCSLFNFGQIFSNRINVKSYVLAQKINILISNVKWMVAYCTTLQGATSERNACKTINKIEVD